MKTAPQESHAVLVWSPKAVAAWSVAGQESRSEEVRSALDQAGSPRTVILALSRRSVFIKQTYLPNVGQGEVRQVLQLQASKLFPVQGPVAFDVRFGTEITSEGRIASAAAVSAETLGQAKGELQAAGSHAVVTMPVAWGSVFLAQEAGLSDAAVVEKGFEGLSIDIVKDGLLRYSRVAPIPTSEDGIYQEIKQTLASAGALGLPIVAAGGLSLSEATKTLKRSSAQALIESGSSAGFNLELPGDIEKREKTYVAARGRFAMLLWVATFVLGWILYTDRADMQAEIDRNQALWQQSVRKDVKLENELKKRVSELESLYKKSTAVLVPTQWTSDVLTLASNLTPAQVWISGMSYDRGRPLQIRGTAMTSEAITEYLDALSNQERFRDVKLVFANNAAIESSTVVNFSITLRVVGNIPLAEPKKKAGGVR